MSTESGVLFPTMVVGSLPRPQWVRDLIEDRKAGHISEAEADRPLAIRLQERAGLDFVSRRRVATRELRQGLRRGRRRLQG